jgi:hypothetical protein
MVYLVYDDCQHCSMIICGDIVTLLKVVISGGSADQSEYYF